MMTAQEKFDAHVKFLVLHGHPIPPVMQAEIDERVWACVRESEVAANCPECGSSVKILGYATQPPGWPKESFRDVIFVGVSCIHNERHDFWVSVHEHDGLASYWESLNGC